MMINMINDYVCMSGVMLCLGAAPVCPDNPITPGVLAKNPGVIGLSYFILPGGASRPRTGLGNPQITSELAGRYVTLSLPVWPVLWQASCLRVGGGSQA